jgi:D-sedoheptulose 7-phosphate isomerase
MSLTEKIQAEFLESQQVLNNFISGDGMQSIVKAADMMILSLKSGGKIISCGNGGSMCDAMHFAEELTGRFRGDRRPLPAVSICDPSYLSCVSNDYGFDFVFSRFIEAHGKKGDILLAISTSGNSKNVLMAIDSAKKIGMSVVGLTGKDGGKMSSLCDAEIRAPQSEFADRAQEIHIKVIHSLILCIEQSV